MATNGLHHPAALTTISSTSSYSSSPYSSSSLPRRLGSGGVTERMTSREDSATFCHGYLQPLALVKTTKIVGQKGGQTVERQRRSKGAPPREIATAAAAASSSSSSSAFPPGAVGIAPVASDVVFTAVPAPSSNIIPVRVKR